LTEEYIGTKKMDTIQGTIFPWKDKFLNLWSADLFYNIPIVPKTFFYFLVVVRLLSVIDLSFNIIHLSNIYSTHLTFIFITISDLNIHLKS